MRITESQLRRIILKEISNLVEAETAGEKAAASAGQATTISSFENKAGKVKDARGLADLIISAIKSSGLGEKLGANKGIIKTALMQAQQELSKI
jgi:hypothetical protein